MWEEVKSVIDTIVNSPVVATLVGVAGLIGAIVGLFKNTSFGKKSIKKMKEDYNEVQAIAEKSRELVNTAIENLNKSTCDILLKVEEGKKEVHNKVVAVYSRVEIYQERLFAILEQIPNAKVQEQVKLLKSDLIDQEGELKDLLGDTYATIKTKLEDESQKKIQEIQEEYNNKYQAILDELNSIQEKLKKKEDAIEVEPIEVESENNEQEDN